MATPEERLEAIRGTIPERIYQSLEERLAGPNREEAVQVMVDPQRAAREQALRVAGRTAALGSGDPGFIDFFRALNNPIGTAKVLAGSAFNTAIVKPLEGLTSLPLLNITQVDEWLTRASEGIYDWAEESGLRAGMDHNEIATMKLVGDLIGFVGPAVASYGAASTLLRAAGRARAVRSASARIPSILTNPQSANPAVRLTAAMAQKGNKMLERFPLVSGGLMTEGVAGAIYEGLLVKPEFGESRVNNALWGAPAFMAGRLLFNVPAQTFQTSTNYLAARSQMYRELRTKATKVFSPFLFKKLTGIRNEIFEAYSEWDQILMSPAALGRLMDGDPNRAGLLTALRENQISKGSMRGAFVYSSEGIERNIRKEMARLRELHPELKLQAVKSGETGLTEIHFSPNVKGLGLNRQQLASIKRHGVYIGQQVKGEGFEGVVAGFDPNKPKTLLIADPITGKTRPVSQINLKTTFGAAGVDDWAGLPDMDNLFNLFKNTVNQNRKVVQAAGMDLTIPQKEALAAKKQLAIDLNERTATFVPGAVTHPEHAGLYNYMTPAQRETYEELRDELIDLDTQLQALKPDSDEALEIIEAIGEVQVELNQMEIFGGLRFADELVEDGTAVRLRENFGETPIGQLFDDFAENAGLPEGAERLAMKASFIRRYTNEALDFVDDDARKLFSDVMDEYFKRLDERGLDLDNLAAMNGFHLFKNETGERFMLRDINTGREFFGRNAEEVRGALNAMRRDAPDLVGGSIALPGLGPIFQRTYKPLRNSMMKPTDDFIIGDLLKRPRLSAIRPIQSILTALEESTNMPLFRLAREIDERFTQAQIDAEPANRILTNISKKWGRLVRSGASNREELLETFAKIYDEFPEGAIEGVTKEEVSAALRRRGVKEELIEIVELFDDVGQVITPQLNRSIQNVTGRQFLPYYAKKFIQQTRATEGILLESPNPRNATNAFEEYVVRMFKAINGKKPVHNLLDDNPVVVMDSFIKEIYMQDSIRPLLAQWENLRNLKVKDLNSLQKTQYATRKNLTQEQLEEAGEEYVINEATRTMLESFQNHYSFNRKKEYENFKNFVNNLTGLLNIEISSELIDEYIRLTSSLMYGATLGFRALPIMANSLQVDMMGIPRFGTRNYTNALKRSMSYEGYREALDAAAIRPNVKSVKFAEGDYVEELTSDAVRAEAGSVIGSMADFIARGLVRSGRWTEEKIAGIGLAPFSSMDDFNRARAYHWQKLEIEQHFSNFAARHGEDFLNSAELRESFAERALMGYRDAKKNLFFDKLKYEGQESAFRYISKQAADDINFVFGRYLGPQVLQEGWGRLFGMFGSWPIWLVDGFAELTKNTTAGQKALMTTRMASITAAYGLVAQEYDVDPWRFHPFAAITWAGGPAVDILGQAIGFIKSSPEKKPAIAFNLLKESALKVMPGSVAAQEWHRSLTRAGGDPLNPEDWYEDVNIDYVLTSLFFGRPDDSQNPLRYEGLLSYRGFQDQLERDPNRRIYDQPVIFPERIWELIDNPLNRPDVKAYFENEKNELSPREYVNQVYGLPPDAYKP